MFMSLLLLIILERFCLDWFSAIAEIAGFNEKHGSYSFESFSIFRD